MPLGDADRAENATIIIEEYNPQRVKMNVLVLPESNKDKPMYLFKKKKVALCKMIVSFNYRYLW